ncbi:MAG TPA: SGNH/GDSL hydrolase family protein [Capillimicrobium sp.]|nr:SGNH/GDSL hydrolase family protein [Capillimicrobium sp.]
MRTRILLVAGALCLLMAGCGADPAVTATTSARIPPIGLTIDEPADEPVPARRGDEGLVAEVRVIGQAEPGSYVRVTSACEAPGCERSAEVSRTGRWSALVRVEAPARRPYARIVAQLAAESAITLVQLTPPKRGRKGRRSGGGRRAGARQERLPEARADGGAAAPGSAEDPLAPVIPGDEAPATPAVPATPPPGSGAVSSLLLIGDSLGVGMRPYLAGLLPGWSVSSDVRDGRTLAEGMTRWRAERGTAAVSAFSLFTNDAPTALPALEAAVRESAQAGCAIWATIARPPQGGTSYVRANQLLERLADELPGRVVVVPWARTVAGNPRYLRDDRVHATAAGYQERARLYARAAQSCV